MVAPVLSFTGSPTVNPAADSGAVAPAGADAPGAVGVVEDEDELGLELEDGPEEEVELSGGAAEVPAGGDDVAAECDEAAAWPATASRLEAATSSNIERM
jgi:hypothetical protein